MADTVICGIDIGSAKIATIVGLQSEREDQIRIIGFNSTPSRGVKRGMVVDIEKVTQSVEESVERAERMAGHKIHSAFLSIGGPHISSLNSHGVVAVSHPQGEIQEDDVNRVIEAARAISLSSTRQIIEVTPRDYTVNGESGIKNPIGMSGVRLEVETHIVTASQTNLKNIDRCLTDVGIENDGFVFSGLASAEAVLTETEKELGVAVVDIGAGKTDITLYVDGSLSYSASIGVGARHVTNDIAVGLRVALDSAEQIKLYMSSKKADFFNKGKSKSDMIPLSELKLAEKLADVPIKLLVDGIIAPRLEEMYKLIAEELAKSGFAQQIPSGLVITGGGSLTAGMLETGKRVIGLPIRQGIPTGVTGLVDEILDPQYATIVGLILSGKRNLIQDDRGSKNFNRLFRDLTVANSMQKLKGFFKQFIP